MATAWNNIYFAQDVPDLTIPWADGDKLRIIVSDNAGNVVATIDEAYAADQSGNITVTNIGDLAMAYISPFSLDGVPAHGTLIAPWCRVAVNVMHEDETTTTYSTKIYYATARTHIANPEQYMGFLSRSSHKVITTDVPVCLSTAASNTVTLGVVYKSGMMRYVELPLTTPGQSGIAVYFLTVAYVAQLAATATEREISAKDIYEIRAMVMSGGMAIDNISFVVDGFHSRNSTVFLFTNCFGCPEAEGFFGADTQNVDMDSEQAFMDNHYRKAWADLTVTNKVHSGHVTRDKFASLHDLAVAPKVYLMRTEDDMEEVTITDIDFGYEKPVTRPQSVAVTYRIAAKTQDVYVRELNPTVRVFDVSFDQSFE